MNVHVITYCNENMTIAAEVCKESALRNNADRVTIFGPHDIDDDFYTKNYKILDADRGAGFWLWKPFIIHKTMQGHKDGDIVIYSDAGVEFINNLNWITDRMKSDIFLFGNSYQHEHWCKMDVLKAIAPTVKFNKQVQASVIFIRVSEWSKMFVERWLDYCTRPGMIDDSKSISKNHPQFQEHRHDQAILTCLAYKNDIELHWWPAIYNSGMFTYDHSGYYDVYPPLFHHHRMRNIEFINPPTGGITHNKVLYMRRKGYKILTK